MTEKIIVLDETDSTNNYAKDLARKRSKKCNSSNCRLSDCRKRKDGKKLFVLLMEQVFISVLFYALKPIWKPVS